MSEVNRGERLLQQAQKRRDEFIEKRSAQEAEYNTFFELLEKLDTADLRGIIIPEKRTYRELFPSLFSEHPTQEAYEEEKKAIMPVLIAVEKLRRILEEEAEALLGAVT
jgi:hypothetical protein